MARTRGPLVAALAMALAQSILYLRGLHPGVADGDSAELQWAAPLLGIAHSPGYALQITVGKLFTMLPLGGDAAWRMNLLSAVCGVVAALALFSAVHRITGRILPALMSQAMLAFGSVFWSQSLIAEVYVFGAAFLCLAIDAVTRYVATGRGVWLATSAFLLGVAVAERPSEILVVPAFAGLLLAFRSRAPVPARRWMVAAACLASPFVIALALNIMRADPARLAARDDAYRDRVIGHLKEEVTYPYTEATGSMTAIRPTLSFMLGLKWNQRLSVAAAARGAAKYATLLAGSAALDDWLAAAGATDPMLKGGVSPGIFGLGLVVLGAIAWRRTMGWVVLGVGLFAGNLIFILVYDAWDSLTFTIPGQIGLAFLAGLGCAGTPVAHGARVEARSPLVRRLVGLIAMLLVAQLVFVNAPHVNRNTKAERKNQELMARASAAPIPEDSAILTKYWPAMTLRYLFWIEAGRSDVSVIHAIRGTHLTLAADLHDQGRPIFFTRGVVSERIEREIAAHTSEELRKLGLLSLGDLPPMPTEPSP